MQILHALLIIFGVINLFFAGVVYFHSTRRLEVALYSLISVFASLWSLATLVTGIFELPFEYFKIALYLHYISGFFAYLSFLWFAFYFPYRSLWAPIIPGGITLFSLLFLGFVPTSYFFTALNPAASVTESIVFNPIGYLFFVFTLTFIFVLGLLMLIVRMVRLTHKQKHDSLDRTQIFFAIISNFVAGTLGITFNLLLPYYGDFSLFYINPILVTLALTGVGLYNLLKYKLFNAKVILAEIFTIAIWVIFLGRIALSKGFEEQIVNTALFIAVVVFGIFLVRSVIKEVRAREEIERLARDLQKANARLKELDERKSEFVSLASHQLRSPLTAIKGYASMLLEGSFGSLTEKAKEAIDRIFQSSERLVTLVEDFLTISRIEQGHLVYNFTSTDLSDLIGPIIVDMRQAIEQKGLSLSFGAEEGKDFLVKADKGKIAQVVGNLIDNASKYTVRGSISVHLSKDENKHTVKFSITDTGVGMSPETKEKVFAKFVRAENAHEVNVSGTGLGLFIAKQLIEAHHGRIGAESKGEGRGSTFYFELPAA